MRQSARMRDPCPNGTPELGAMLPARPHSRGHSPKDSIRNPAYPSHAFLLQTAIHPAAYKWLGWPTNFMLPSSIQTRPNSNQSMPTTPACSVPGIFPASPACSKLDHKGTLHHGIGLHSRHFHRPAIIMTKQAQGSRVQRAHEPTVTQPESPTSGY